MTDWNTQIIDEFRANDGKVGGQFEGFPLLILHSTGAKSGLERLNPLAYRAVNGGYAVFGSKAGAPSHPDWFHNLVANPRASVEVKRGFAAPYLAMALLRISTRVLISTVTMNIS